MSDSVLDAAEAAEPAVAAIADEIADELVTAAAVPTLDQRAAVLTAVQDSRELPPGVRERLRGLVQQAVTLDVAGEPLLATRQVLELLAQGLPPALRRETPTATQRPDHPAGDAFFALQGEELTDHQADQIARQQLQRAGLLRTT